MVAPSFTGGLEVTIGHRTGWEEKVHANVPSYHDFVGGLQKKFCRSVVLDLQMCLVQNWGNVKEEI